MLLCRRRTRVSSRRPRGRPRRPRRPASVPRRPPPPMQPAAAAPQRWPPAPLLLLQRHQQPQALTAAAGRLWRQWRSTWQKPTAVVVRQLRAQRRDRHRRLCSRQLRRTVQVAAQRVQVLQPLQAAQQGRALRRRAARQTAPRPRLRSCAACAFRTAAPRPLSCRTASWTAPSPWCVADALQILPATGLWTLCSRSGLPHHLAAWRGLHECSAAAACTVLLDSLRPFRS